MEDLSYGLGDRGRYPTSSMLNAQLYYIAPNDRSMDDFMCYEPVDPWDDFEWFSIDVGTPGMGGQDCFQCLVTTTRARHRAIAGSKDSRCVVIDPYEPQTIIDTLTNKINSVEGLEWCNIVDELRKFMRWEYEGMDSAMAPHFPRGPS